MWVSIYIILEWVRLFYNDINVSSHKSKNIRTDMSLRLLNVKKNLFPNIHGLGKLLVAYMTKGKYPYVKKKFIKQICKRTEK